MIRKTILIAGCMLGLLQAKAQQIGANFNESIEVPIQYIDLLKESKVKWVRGFIDFNINYLNIDSEGNLIGIKENSIETYDRAAKFVDAKKALGDRVKFILSYKIPFEEYNGVVPEVGSPEMEIIFEAAERVLLAHDMGNNIEILTMGNEPQFENNSEDGPDYQAFLHEFANRIASWKEKHGWDFEIYAGALNRVADYSDDSKNEIIKAVTDVVNNNENVSGIDLHIHAAKVSQANDDLALIRGKWGVTKDIISTEFTVKRLLDINTNRTLGAWGVANGYSSDMKMYEYLNAILRKKYAGNPVSYDELKSYFESASWYQMDWYTTFYEKFKAAGVRAITGRFVVEPKPREDFQYEENAMMWDLGGLYLEMFLGLDENGKPYPNPLVYPYCQPILNDMYDAESKIENLTFSSDQHDVTINWNAFGLTDLNCRVTVADNISSHSDTIVGTGDLNAFIEQLKPANEYNITVEDLNCDAIARASFKTQTSQNVDFASVKIQKNDDSYTLHMQNLPADFTSYHYKLNNETLPSAFQFTIKAQDKVDAIINFEDNTSETISLKLD